MTTTYTRKQHAQRLLAELRKAGDPSRVMTEPKFWRCGEPFCLRYFEECDAVLFEDPARGLEWAKLAPFLAGMLDCEEGLRRKELIAHGHAVRGSAERAAGDFKGAEESYSKALQLARREGIGESVRGNVWRRLAVLRMDQKRFAESFELADRAIAIYRAESSFQARQDLAWSLVVRGLAQLNAGQHKESLLWLVEALQYADPKASPRTYQTAVHNSAYAVTRGACDDPEAIGQAYRHIRTARRKLRDQHRSLPRAKLVWLEGLLLARVHAGRAEEAYRDARGDLIRFGAAYDACLISLDLGALYLEAERWATLRELAAETLALAVRLEVDAEAVAALRLWSRAVEAEQAAAVAEQARAVRAALGR